MYACFHIGCVSSQFITKPFLIPNEKEYSSECYGNAHSQVQHSNNTDSVYSGISVTSPMDIQKVHVSELLTRAQNSSKNFITDSEDMISNSTFTFDDSVIATETHIWKAFLIAGIVLFAAAVLNMAIYMLDSHCKDPNSNIKGDAKTKPGVENKGSSLSIALIVHVTVFLFIVCCIQRTINSYLFAYAVQCHSWQKSLAVFLKVCYQSGAFTGRVLSIFLLLHVKPQVLLMVCVLGSVAAFSCIAVIGNQTVVMWLSNVVVGLCMGPMYGCALSWGSQHFTVGAKAGAAISFGVTSSEILGSLVINLMYDKFGLATYSYLNLILMVSLAALVLSMVVTIKCIESKKSKYRYSLANDNKAETAGEETNLWSQSGTSSQYLSTQDTKLGLEEKIFFRNHGVNACLVSNFVTSLYRLSCYIVVSATNDSTDPTQEWDDIFSSVPMHQCTTLYHISIIFRLMYQ